MAEYMEKERAETIEQQKAHLAKMKEFAGEKKKIEAETVSRLKDCEARNRTWEKKLGTEIE